MHNYDRTVSENEFENEFENENEFGFLGFETEEEGEDEFEEEGEDEGEDEFGGLFGFETEEEGEEEGEDEYEMEDEYEEEGEDEGESEGEDEYEEEGEDEMEGEDEYELEGEDESESEDEVFNEATEMELATELLSVGNEAELEDFLGGLFKKIGRGVSNFANSAAGQQLGGILKGVAKKALPILGTAAGTFLGGPVGASLGGKLGNMASGLFELELEGLSNEDKEFEIARAYVRYAGKAAKLAAKNPRVRTQPRKVARRAAIVAAKTHAPGLLKRKRRMGSNRPGLRRKKLSKYGGSPMRRKSGKISGRGRSLGRAPVKGTGFFSSGKWFIRGGRMYLKLKMVPKNI
jgi:hypothetical protein